MFGLDRGLVSLSTLLFPVNTQIELLYATLKYIYTNIRTWCILYRNNVTRITQLLLTESLTVPTYTGQFPRIESIMSAQCPIC